MLLETILSHVVRNVEDSIPDIRSCRLVQKGWRNAISSCLRKCRQPLFRLRLDKTNSIDGTGYVQENGKLLRKFVNKMTGEARMEDVVPPFKIIATAQFFRSDNFQDFVDCLTLCGESLVELMLQFPKDGGSMTYILPSLSLPKLTKLSVRFSIETLDGVVDVFTNRNNNNSVYLIQWILSNCEELSQAIFMDDMAPFNGTPLGFGSIQYPETITDLEFSCSFAQNCANHLLQSTLPTLKRLRVTVSYTQRASNLVLRFLDHVRTSLEELSINFYHPLDRSSGEYFHFPVMPNLKIFRTRQIPLEGNLAGFAEKFPVVTQMILADQTVSMFEKWTQGSRLETVTNLTIRLSEKEYNDGEDSRYPPGFDAGMMERLDRTFPNLKSLSIRFCDKEESGVRYLFGHLEHLEELHIRVASHEEIKGSNLWDALLIGVPLNRINAVRKTPELLGTLGIAGGECASIRNLAQLKILGLNTEYGGPTSPNRSLISRAAFNMAFLKMAKLVTLKIGGRFKVSKEMMLEWEAAGRAIEIEPEKCMDRLTAFDDLFEPVQ